MDDVIIRSRYSRSNQSYRKRKYRTRENNRYGTVIRLQILLSIIVFLFIWSYNKIDKPFANYIIDKTKEVLTWNIDFSNILYQINNLYDTDEDKAGNMQELQDKKRTGEEAVEKSDKESEGNTLSDPNRENRNTDNIDNINNIDNIDNNSENSTHSRLDFGIPIEGTVTSYFGEILDPVTGKTKYHGGIDIETTDNAVIRAVEDGEVIEVSEDPMYGKYIKLYHLGNITSIYAHCSEILVTKDMKLKKGEIMGSVGNNEISVGSHLHFEIWKDERPQNPLDFIKISNMTKDINEIL